jgi:hypothetical protein
MATPLFGLPEITEGQAGKYITHNETIAMIEGLISRVLSANTGGPPVSPDDGSTYIVDVAIEDWASASVNDIAHYYSGSWHFISPITGFAIWCADQTRRIYYSGTDWVSQTNFLYQAWLDQGNTGTEQDFLDAFKGDKGDKGDTGDTGATGDSAYQTWLNQGNTGTEADFLVSIGAGDSAYQIWLNQGNTGTEQDFLDALKGDKGDTGDTGDSAYQTWLNQGNTGTEADFLVSIGAGDSAYQIWLDQGNTGTEQDFLDALKGDKGDTGDTGATGDSAYQVWLDQGNTGTEQDFLDAISGSSGGGATTDDMVKYAIIFG